MVVMTILMREREREREIDGCELLDDGSDWKKDDVRSFGPRTVDPSCRAPVSTGYCGYRTTHCNALAGIPIYLAGVAF